MLHLSKKLDIYGILLNILKEVVSYIIYRLMERKDEAYA